MAIGSIEVIRTTSLSLTLNLYNSPISLSETMLRIRQNVSQLLIPKLQAMEASSVGPGGIEELTDVQCDNYVMTPYGMTWMFSPYEVASYAEGEFFVKVPWSELRPIMRRTPLMDPVPESGLGG